MSCHCHNEGCCQEHHHEEHEHHHHHEEGGIRESIIKIAVAIVLLIPAGIAVLFVVPNGIYHNIFTFMALKIMNLGQRRKYIYGGIRQYVSEEKE